MHIRIVQHRARDHIPRPVLVVPYLVGMVVREGLEPPKPKPPVYMTATIATPSIASLRRAERSAFRTMSETFRTMLALDKAGCDDATYLRISALYREQAGEHIAILAALDARYAVPEPEPRPRGPGGVVDGPRGARRTSSGVGVAAVRDTETILISPTDRWISYSQEHACYHLVMVGVRSQGGAYVSKKKGFIAVTINSEVVRLNLDTVGAVSQLRHTERGPEITVHLHSVLNVFPASVIIRGEAAKQLDETIRRWTVVDASADQV